MTVDFDLNDTYKHKGLRRRLVELIRSKGIQDERVLKAIEKVPRHFFLDSAFQELAYEDQAMPIDEDQTISQPFTVAYQTEKLEVDEGHKVLEIGLGSGYQACVLLELGADVYSIERIPALYEKAKILLPLMNYHPKMFLGDGTLGLPEHAPFDRIIVTAAAPEIPKALIKQLKIGGKMIIPVGNRQVQTMYQLTKISETEVRKKALDTFRFVPLVGKQGWKI